MDAVLDFVVAFAAAAANGNAPAAHGRQCGAEVRAAAIAIILRAERVSRLNDAGTIIRHVRQQRDGATVVDFE